MCRKVFAIDERMLQMVDKSKNEQYDIVAQAEKVLSDYIKRYFSLRPMRTVSKKKKRKKAALTLFALGALAMAICVCAIIYFS